MIGYAISGDRWIISVYSESTIIKSPSFYVSSTIWGSGTIGPITYTSTTFIPAFFSSITCSSSTFSSSCNIYFSYTTSDNYLVSTILIGLTATSIGSITTTAGSSGNVYYSRYRSIDSFSITGSCYYWSCVITYCVIS